jgi:hypothetical protein
MYITIGLLVGILTGALNFFIFEKQMKVFLPGKKWYLIIAGYIVRYAVIGVVFYFSVKKNTPLFLGVLAGFFLTQLIFFSKKARLH